MPSELLEEFVRSVYGYRDEQYIQHVTHTFTAEGRRDVTFIDFAFALCLLFTASPTIKLKCMCCIANLFFFVC
jgi:hypothetical protein